MARTGGSSGGPRVRSSSLASRPAAGRIAPEPEALVVDLAAAIRSLSPETFFVMVAFVLLCTAVPVYAGLHARSRMRRVAATPVSAVALAEDGYRALEGTLEAIGGSSLAAPLTGAPCAWYHAKVEVYRRRTTTSQGTWNTLRETTSLHPFLLRDGTGVAVVLPDGAEVTPTDRSVWYGPDPVPADRNPSRFKPTESPEGMVRVHGGRSHRYRYTEERMYAGDPLYALGNLTKQPWDEEDEEEADDGLDEAASDRGIAGRAARDVGGEEDEGEAGEQRLGGEESGETTSAMAWGPGWNGDERYEELRARAAALTARRIERGRSGPFILSTTPRQAMLEPQRLGWKAALAVALVPLGLVALLLWLRYT